MQAHLPAHHLAELANGNAAGLIADCNDYKPDGCGGGIFIHDARPIIVNNVRGGYDGRLFHRPQRLRRWAL